MMPIVFITKPGAENDEFPHHALVSVQRLKWLLLKIFNHKMSEPQIS